MDTHRYIVTVEYVTPYGKRSSYTETVWHFTPFEASSMVKEWLYAHPRRKVAHITSASVTR